MQSIYKIANHMNRVKRREAKSGDEEHKFSPEFSEHETVFCETKTNKKNKCVFCDKFML